MSRTHVLRALVASCLLAGSPLAAHAAAPSAGRAVADAAAAPTGQVQLIQGVPGVRVSVSVDGDEVQSGAAVGSILPLQLSPGRHDVVFSHPDGTSAQAEVDLAVGRSSDVVYHLPASLSGDPVVSTYRTPTKAIGPGKARVLVAHTATLAPADVEVDGKTIFSDIANGEFAEAEVPAGTLSVALIASGSKGAPVLGPIDLTVKASTVTMVYAVGRPSDGTMQVITRDSTISSDGTVVPDAIDTGSADLAADLPVSTFAASQPVASDNGIATSPWALLTLAGALVVAGGALSRRRATQQAQQAPATSVR